MSVRKRTILLLEDDPIQVMLFQGMISDGTTEVVTADNVFDALRIIKASPIAACVVDLGVYRKFREYDDGAGIEFIVDARKVADPDMPIVVVSGTRDPAVLIPCFEAGCDDYVMKTEGVQGAATRLRSWMRMLPLTAEDLQAKRAVIIETLRESVSR